MSREDLMHKRLAGDGLCTDHALYRGLSPHLACTKRSRCPPFPPSSQPHDPTSPDGLLNVSCRTRAGSGCRV